MRWEHKVQFATLSDTGMRRKNNQDALSVQTASDAQQFHEFGHLFVVCDGMGGHAVGELASKLGVDTIPLLFFKGRPGAVSASLREAIEQANAVIHERGSQNIEFNRMGTTCVALVLSPLGASVAHVGDSRCYRVRQDRVEQLTFDHSLEWELQRSGRAAPGQLSLPEIKHVITRSLGPEPETDVELDGPHPVEVGDRFVLCSDGLTGHLSDSEIGMIVRELPPEEAAHLLINLANVRGGTDNVTAVVVQVGSPAAGPDSGPEAQIDLPRRNEPAIGLGVFFVMLFWLTVLVLLIGVLMLILGQRDAGIGFTGTAITGLLLLVRYWSKQPRPAPPENLDVTRDCHIYRAASSRLTPEFLAGLLKLAGDLRELALDEKWSITWADHDAALATARQAVEQRQGARALSHIGIVIDLLMTGLHAHRRKQKLEKMNSDG